ncbi:hypothetical protein DPSP01_005939 [Paraphaeosphaeria sporulosa]
MSTPTGAAHQAHTGEDGPRRLIQTTPQVSPTHPHPIVHALQRDSPRDASSSASLSLPPLRQMSSTPPLGERRPGGPLGMHSILNPQADLLEQHRGQRRSASHAELPSPIEHLTPPNLPSISRPTSVESTQDETVPARQFQQPFHPRRGPLSPTIHRTQSLSVLNPPTGTIDAHQSPFISPSGRPSAMDSITSQPALPTPPVVGIGSRAAYFPTAPTPPPTMVRNDLRRPSMGFPQSGSASPIAGFSPYSQPASVASSQVDAGSQHQHHYVPAPGHAPMQEAHQIPMAVDTDRGRISMAPTGQSSIQIMTIKSQQGHHRNAGASARFRARRKEKEREASMSIARLEQQLRDALEDREFYRNERDYFQNLVYQQPGADRHYGRPTSPRLRRPSVSHSNAASSNTGGGSAGSPYSAYDDDDVESDRNVRRRTSTYHPPLGQTAAPLNGTGPPSSTHPAATFSSVNATAAGMSSHRQPQPHHHYSTQQAQLHDPFASDPARYEQRNWAPAPGQLRESR